jgi:hypothetical protein
MNEKQLKQWLVRQFRSSCSHAWPAREVIGAVTVAVFGFGIVVVLGGEGVECSSVGWILDGSHVLAVGVRWTWCGHGPLLT